MKKECVAVLIELYKKNVTVSCVGSDLELFKFVKVSTKLKCPSFIA